MQTGKPLYLFGFVLVLCSLAAFKKKDATQWISLDEAQKQLSVSKKTSIDRPLYRLVRLV